MKEQDDHESAAEVAANGAAFAVSAASAATVAPTAGVDAKDATILDMLEADGHATLAQLAKATGLSVSTVQSRVQKLEKRGVIKGYSAVIDHDRRGLPISAFVSVTPLDYAREADIPRKLRDVDGVVSCYSVAGAPSFILLVRVATPAKLEELLNLIHRTVPVSTESTVILKTYF